MRKSYFSTFRVVLAGLLTVLIFSPVRVMAHCDGMDGPVVKAAQRALETGNIDFVLIWVQKADEPAVREAFRQTATVRKLGDEARALADRYFFETVVRLHRAGEGAPYTGLKPAGRDLGPAIPAADAALEKGSSEALGKLLTGTVQDGVTKHFQEVLARKNFPVNDVAAGREYVKAYVEFIHYVERIHQAASGPVRGHHAEEAENAAPPREDPVHGQK